MAPRRPARAPARRRRGRAGWPFRQPKLHGQRTRRSFCRRSAKIGKCEACGERIENPRRGQRFCYWPRRCRKSPWAEQHRRPYKLTRPPQPCEWCHEPIENPRKNQKFCRPPRDCRGLAGYERSLSSGADRNAHIARASAGIAESAREVALLPAVVSAAKPARGSEVSPMIGILLESMPAPGASWTAAARAQWMAVFECTLDALYPAPRG